MIRKNLKLFFISMAISFIFIMLIVGIIIVERNISSVIFGDNNPFLELTHKKMLRISFLDQTLEINLKNITDYITKIFVEIYLKFTYVR